MKNLFARIVALLLVFGSLALIPAVHAQRTPRIIKANIPFEFAVGDRLFPAGNYSVVSTAPSVLELRDTENRILVMVLTNSVESSRRPSSPTLQFKSTGEGYALTQVWQENFSIGQQVKPPTSWEKLAKSGPEHTLTVAINNPR